MKLEYVPLLRVMRELHDIPRGQPPDFNGMKGHVPPDPDRLKDGTVASAT